MPLYNVVRCYSCSAFQVIERRSNKRSANTTWRSRGGGGLGTAKFTCKLCHERQSEREVFASFANAREARQSCMALSARRADADAERERSQLRDIQRREAEEQRLEEARLEEAWRRDRRHKALFAYTAQADDELSFGKGDSIIILAKKSALGVWDNGWWKGFHERSEREGMLPSNYLEFSPESVTEPETGSEIVHGVEPEPAAATERDALREPPGLNGGALSSSSSSPSPAVAVASSNSANSSNSRWRAFQNLVPAPAPGMAACTVPSLASANGTGAEVMSAGACVGGGALEAHDSNRDRGERRPRMRAARLAGGGHGTSACATVFVDSSASAMGAIGAVEATGPATGTCASTSLMQMLCGHRVGNADSGIGSGIGTGSGPDDGRRKRQRLGF